MTASDAETLAVKKQVPRVAKIHEKSGHLYCPSCHRGVFINYTYCPTCGQRLAFKE